MNMLKKLQVKNFKKVENFFIREFEVGYCTRFQPKFALQYLKETKNYGRLDRITFHQLLLYSRLDKITVLSYLS